MRTKIGTAEINMVSNKDTHSIEQENPVWATLPESETQGVSLWGKVFFNIKSATLKNRLEEHIKPKFDEDPETNFRDSEYPEFQMKIWEKYGNKDKYWQVHWVRPANELDSILEKLRGLELIGKSDTDTYVETGEQYGILLRLNIKDDIGAGDITASEMAKEL